MPSFLELFGDAVGNLTCILCALKNDIDITDINFWQLESNSAGIFEFYVNSR